MSIKAEIEIFGVEEKLPEEAKFVVGWHDFSQEWALVAYHPKGSVWTDGDAREIDADDRITFWFEQPQIPAILDL